MSQILTIIAGDAKGGEYAKAVMWVAEEIVEPDTIAEFRTGIRAAYKASFGREAESVIVMVDDHIHEHVIPAYVARVAGTDHAESAHDTLAKAAHQAMDSELTVMVAVTPERTS